MKFYRLAEIGRDLDKRLFPRKLVVTETYRSRHINDQMTWIHVSTGMKIDPESWIVT